MNLMNLFCKSAIFALFYAIFLTHPPSQAATKAVIPTCPEGTEREFFPSPSRPLWASCKSANGLYQGLMIQFSGQTELIRVAAMKNSLRNGKEIRFGEAGFLEERNFKDGHLDGPTYLFKAEFPLARVFPKAATPSDWAQFTRESKESILRAWIKADPVKTLEFSKGRLTRIVTGDLDYRFTVSKEGRIYAQNHKEMKGRFFIDPEAIWDLNAVDLKAALQPGFGSCNKYAGPIGRFGRHYDVLIFKRLPSQKAHEERLEEIRTRFLNFCVPEDIRKNLGAMECPPQLPGNLPAHHCTLGISDHFHLPYEKKYFKFEFTLGHSPEDIHALLRKLDVDRFLSTPDKIEDMITLSPTAQIRIKKTVDGLKFRLVEKDSKGRIIVKKENEDGSKDWWEWHRIPGL